MSLNPLGSTALLVNDAVTLGLQLFNHMSDFVTLSLLFQTLLVFLL